MHLNTPADLPQSLAERWARVRDRVGGIDTELPAALESSAARVLTSSEFVLEHGSLDLVVPRSDLKSPLGHCLRHLS